MANNQQPCCEKFKTMIGGQALIEGIMMRGPKKDAIVIRTADGLTLEVSDRKLNPEKSFKNWPFFRGIFNFFDAQVTGVKALMRSADLAPEESQEEPSKLDKWLEEKLGNEKFQKAAIGFAVVVDDLYVTLRRQNLLPVENKEAVLLLYEKEQESTAYERASSLRNDGHMTVLLRKDPSKTERDYKTYAEAFGYSIEEI